MADAPELKLPAGYREGLPASWRPWLRQLPELVATYLQRWELAPAGELPLSHSYVLPVERTDGRQCVLKVQPTDVVGLEGAERELLGLRLAGPVAVEVVDEDARNGVLLIERVSPGTTLERLAEVDDDAATQAMAMVIRDYGRPLDDPVALGLRPFEEFAEVFERFDRGPHGDAARRRVAAAPETRLSVVLGLDESGTSIPPLRVARETAERVLEELLADHTQPYLLHGDLHHGNVLEDEQRGLRVIDPWGLWGSRTAEIAPALENPIDLVDGVPDVDSLVGRRLAIYAEVLGADTELLTAWSYAYSVIRALWSLEDSGDAGSLRTVDALRRRI